MNFTQLALGISGAIALQLAVFAGYAFFRHWQLYTQLRLQLVGGQRHAAMGQRDASTSMGSPAWKGLRTFVVSRKVVEDAARQICSFYLQPQDGVALPPFLPGQFLTFRLEIASEAGHGQDADIVTRCYSLSDAPRPDAYRVSIKRAARPAGAHFAPGKSSHFFHDHIEVGSQLQVRAPSGHFYLERGDWPVVLIGGGIGLTPMVSMLQWCALEQPEREVWFFYGVRNASELAMLPELQSLAAAHTNFHMHLCFSHPETGETTHPQGDALHRHCSRVTLALLRSLLPLKPYHYYLCGPTAMLASLVPELDEWGVPDDRIHFEAFGPASVPRKHVKNLSTPAVAGTADAAPLQVTFSRSSQQVQWIPGTGSLLEFAENLGIHVESGCRAGSCGTCQVRIEAGEVRYLQTPDADPETGTCLLCVCVPKTSVTLDA